MCIRDRPQLEAELTAHEAAMKKYESEANGPAELAVISAKRHSTLAGRLEGWFAQKSREDVYKRQEWMGRPVYCFI